MFFEDLSNHSNKRAPRIRGSMKSSPDSVTVINSSAISKRSSELRFPKRFLPTGAIFATEMFLPEEFSAGGGVMVFSVSVFGSVSVG